MDSEEVNYGGADFIAKLQIALKECSESEYRLELLIESRYYDNRAILEQCSEVKKTSDCFHQHSKGQCKVIGIYSVAILHNRASKRCPVKNSDFIGVFRVFGAHFYRYRRRNV